ncbi:MAG: beta-CASP ribonuclease aCPSF1 [Candidatus Anstonellales archaeon]
MDFQLIEEGIKKIVPKECEITGIYPEGLEIVIYVKNIKLFYEQEQIIIRLASALKKKVSVRADQSVLMPPEQAKEKILEIVPKEAEITNIYFLPDFSKVMIEALKPGIVIGKQGMKMKEIIFTTGWTPKIVRTPTIHSQTLDLLRKGCHVHAKSIKKTLLNLGKKLISQIPDNPNWITLTFLGATQEVGRSCIYLKTGKERFLLDCGINPDTSDLKSMFPAIGEADVLLEKLDGIILSHAHLDHCGFLPFLYKMGYDGPIYCTPPTRDLTALLITDLLEIWEKSSIKDFNIPYSKKDIYNMLHHMIVVDYGEVVDISGNVKLTFYNAGHILGSAITHLHIGEGMHNLVYTGDIKCSSTKLFNTADTNIHKIDTLIIEATYGGKNDVMPEREVMEKQFMDEINQTLAKKGKVLIPVFSVGRAQEIMLVLEEYARNNKDWNVPVYLDGMILEASAIHTAYPEYLKKLVQMRILSNNSPFESEIFKVAKGKSREEIVNGEPCIILAPSGMMSGGPVIDFFRLMADNPNNKLIFVGYQAANSLGRKIQQGAKEIALNGHDNGKTDLIKINLEIKSIEGFSGHSDRIQMIQYLKKMRNKISKIFTVHGEANKTIEFAQTLGRIFKGVGYAPLSLETVRLK